MYVDEGFGVDHDDLAGYRQAAQGLADELRAVATSTLYSTSELPADAFGRIGAEVGLDSAFRNAATTQLVGIGTTADGVDELATSVGTAGAGYQQNDEDQGSTVRRAGRA